MPVTVYPAQHPSEPLDLHNLLRNADRYKVLRNCLGVKYKEGQTSHIERIGEIYTSSFDNEDQVDVFPSANGFVHAAIRAYNAHLHLRIRPDDVWIAILTQFSIYVNKHAEALRSIFVQHKGKKDLCLEGAVIGNLKLDHFASKISDVLAKNVIDPSIPAWIMQEFSTTTPVDRIAAGIIMMATFQSYFNYHDSFCGLPSVTLLGDRADWVQLLDAVDRLNTFVPEEEPPIHEVRQTTLNGPAEQMKKWVSVLKPVLRRLINTFDAPASTDTINFWQQIVDYRIGGSGADYMSGWLTAFCFWNESGDCIYRPGSNRLCLDGVYYSTIDWDDIPPGWATVPLQLTFDDGETRQCRMLAGSVGMTPFLAEVEGHGAIWKQPKQVGRKSKGSRQGEANSNQPSGKGKDFVHRLLACCGESDDSDISEPRKHSLPTSKETAKSSPYPTLGETVVLPPHPERPSTDARIPPPYNGERAVQDYENGPRFRDMKGALAPPNYKLDGLQPRIGWWLWEEKEEVVSSNAPSPLPDRLENVRRFYLRQ